MSDTFETPGLFSDLPAGTEQLPRRKPAAGRKTTGRVGKQLKMFAEADGNVRDGIDIPSRPLGVQISFQ